jgi:hypothetical protein
MDTDIGRTPGVAGATEIRAVQQWLEDVWRHGEVVEDADGLALAGGGRGRPIDRARDTAGPSPFGRWLAVAGMAVILTGLVAIAFGAEILGILGVAGLIGGLR